MRSTDIHAAVVASAHPGLVQWLAGGERGISSDAMVEQLTGMATSDWRRVQDWPVDPSDFRRCQKLMDQVPTLRPLLPRMADRSPGWAALLMVWDEVATLVAEELPSGRAPKAYALMRRTLAGLP
jgi:hypothetical protein